MEPVRDPALRPLGEVLGSGVITGTHRRPGRRRDRRGVVLGARPRSSCPGVAGAGPLRRCSPRPATRRPGPSAGARCSRPCCSCCRAARRLGDAGAVRLARARSPAAPAIRATRSPGWRSCSRPCRASPALFWLAYRMTVPYRRRAARCSGLVVIVGDDRGAARGRDRDPDRRRARARWSRSGLRRLAARRLPGAGAVVAVRAAGRRRARARRDRRCVVGASRVGDRPRAAAARAAGRRRSGSCSRSRRSAARPAGSSRLRELWRPALRRALWALCAARAARARARDRRLAGGDQGGERVHRARRADRARRARARSTGIATATRGSSAAATATTATRPSTPARPRSPTTASTRTASAATRRTKPPPHDVAFVAGAAERAEGLRRPADHDRHDARRPPRHVRLRAPDHAEPRQARRRRHRVRARLGPRTVDALLDAGDPDRPAAARRLLRHLGRGLARPVAEGDDARRGARAARASPPARSRTTGTSTASATWTRASPSTTTRTRASTRASPAPGPSRPRAARRRSRPTRRSRSSSAHADGKRWFLWVHYYDPHYAYEPHPEVPSFGTDRVGALRRRDAVHRPAHRPPARRPAREGPLRQDRRRRHRRSRRGLRRARRRAPRLSPVRAADQGAADHPRARARAAPRARRPPATSTSCRRSSTSPAGTPTADMMGRSLVDVLAGKDSRSRGVPAAVVRGQPRDARRRQPAVPRDLQRQPRHELGGLPRRSRSARDRRTSPAMTTRAPATRRAVERWYDAEQVPAGRRRGAAAGAPGDRGAARRRSRRRRAPARGRGAGDREARRADHADLDVRGARRRGARAGSCSSTSRGPDKTFVNGDHRPGAPVRVVEARPVHPLHDDRRRCRALAPSGAYTRVGRACSRASARTADRPRAKVDDNAVAAATIEVVP